MKKKRQKDSSSTNFSLFYPSSSKSINSISCDPRLSLEGKSMSKITETSVVSVNPSSESFLLKYDLLLWLFFTLGIALVCWFIP